MENNKKISHLSEEQLKEVREMYLNKKIKISEILNKYNIDVSTSSLLKILPPIITNEICKICGENLYEKIKSRTAYSYSNEKKDRFCLSCGHKEYGGFNRNRKECNCEGCKAIAELEHESMKKKIRDTYNQENNVIEFEDLILEDKIKLIYILLNNSYNNISQIAPIIIQKNYIEYINRLLEIKAISVSPENNVDAFLEEDFPKRYFVAKVIYDVNVNIKEVILNGINNNSYFLEFCDEDELIEMLKEFIYYDLIEKFEEMLASRKLQLHISEKAKESFVELIDKISYTQILDLCNRVAIFFLDKVTIGEMTKFFARNAALTNVSKFYNRAVEEEWILKHREIESLGYELKFFIKKVLNKDISILKDVASVENLKTWKKRENDYSKKTGYKEE